MKGVDGSKAIHVLGAKTALNPALLTTVKVLISQKQGKTVSLEGHSFFILDRNVNIKCCFCKLRLYDESVRTSLSFIA